MTDLRGYALVTGANGFIGSQVLRRLLDDPPSKPWSEVRALVRTDAAADQVRALGARPVRGDLLDPGPEVRDVVAGARYVAHCAHPTRHGQHADRPRMDRRLLESIDPARLARLVYVCGSSYLGASEGGELVDEATPPRPFGVGVQFEEGLRALREAPGLDYAAALVAGVYGRGSWFLELCARALERGDPVPVRDPAPVWPYLHVEDCARAIELLLAVSPARLDEVGREIILADEEPAPMDAFIAEIARALGRPLRLARLDEAALRALLPPAAFVYWTTDMRHSSARLRRLGFACRYPTFREGIPALGLAAGPATEIDS